MNETQRLYQEKRSTLERIEQLEQNQARLNKNQEALKAFIESLDKDVKEALTSIVQGTNRQFEIIGPQLDQLRSSIEVMLDMQDPTQLEAAKAKYIATMETRRKEQTHKALTTEGEEVRKLISEGVLTVTDKVGPQAVIGGIETKPDGTRTFDFDGTMFVQFARMTPVYQELFLNKVVGDEVQTVDNVTFKITEIYNASPHPMSVVTPPEVVASETPEAAQ